MNTAPIVISTEEPVNLFEAFKNAIKKAGELKKIKTRLSDYKWTCNLLSIQKEITLCKSKTMKFQIKFGSLTYDIGDQDANFLIDQFDKEQRRRDVELLKQTKLVA